MIVLLVLALYGANPLVRPWWGDGLLLAASVLAMYVVAWGTLMLEKRQGRRKGAENPALSMAPAGAAPGVATAEPPANLPAA